MEDDDGEVHSPEDPISSTDYEEYEVSEVFFRVMTREEIVRNSVIEPTGTLNDQGIPVPDGMNSLKLGTTDPRYLCATCGQDMMRCVGHTGHIKLAVPLVNPLFPVELHRVLQSVCFGCNRPKLDHEKLRGKTFNDASKRSIKLKNTTVCQRCLFFNPEIHRLGAKFDYSFHEAVIRESAVRLGVHMPHMTVASVSAPNSSSLSSKRKRKTASETKKAKAAAATVVSAEEDESASGTLTPLESAFLNEIKTGMWTQEEFDAWITNGIPSTNSVMLASYRNSHLSPTSPRWLSTTTIENLLRNIPDCDYEVYGFLRKNGRLDQNFLITHVVVPPVSIRPSLRLPGATKIGQDEFTKMLVAIEKTNQKIKSVPLEDTDEFVKNVLVAQEHIVQYFNPTQTTKVLPRIKAVQRKEAKSLTSDLAGKKGLVRKTMMGKRVNFAGRTVIASETNLDVDELAVPLQFAMTLTIPETINRYNIEDLRKRVALGADSPFGAKSIVSSDGMITTSLAHMDRVERDSIELEVGMVVHRPLKDGDTVIFNRQPTIHIGSMMAHKVKILYHSPNELVLRPHVEVRKPYNFDYDGDECNIHVLQRLDARIEAATIMSVEANSLDGQTHSPMFSFIQDSMLGAYIITNGETMISRALFFQLGCRCKYTSIDRIVALFEEGKKDPKATRDSVPGRFAFSILLPEDFTISRPRKFDIVEGVLKPGFQLKSNSLGTSEGSIVHELATRYGRRKVIEFLSDGARLLLHFMSVRGFSIGWDDVRPTKEIRKAVEFTIEQAKEVARDRMENRKDVNSLMLEDSVSSLFRTVLAEAGNAIDGLLDPMSNSLLGMVACGSKGKITNVVQIVACVGQQTVSGMRPRLDQSLWSGGDTLAEDRGFVTSCYSDGMTPVEYCAAAEGGKEGLVATAVGTADTGYGQRRMGQAMTGINKEHDGTVRTDRGTVIQMSNGGGVPWNVSCLRTNATFAQTIRDSDSVDTWMVTFEFLTRKHGVKSHETICQFLRRKIEEARETLDEASKLINAIEPNPLLPFVVRDEMELELEAMRRSKDRTIRFDSEAKISNEIHRWVSAERIGSIGLYQLMTVVIEVLRWIHLRFVESDASDAEDVLSKAATRLNALWQVQEQNLVPSGTAIGILAATSVGAPVTQSNLNVFHYAGTREVKTTAGAARMREIVDCSKGISTPSMTLRLNMDAVRQDLPQYAHLEDATLRTVAAAHLDSMIWSEIQNEVLMPDEAVARNLVPSATTLKRIDEWSPVENGHKRNYHRMVEGNLVVLLNNRLLKFHGCRRDDVRDSVFKSVSEAAISVFFVGDATLHIRITNPYELPFKRNSSSKKMPKLSVGSVLVPPEDFGPIDLAACYIYLRKYLETNFMIERVPKVHRFVASGSSDIVRTVGSNFKFMLSHPWVETRSLTTNDFIELSALLGIEAARTVIVDEIGVTLRSESIYVARPHIELMADRITHNGSFDPMTRHGMERMGHGTLQRASFEQTSEIFRRAALLHTRDEQTNGIASSLMTGRLVRAGTGSVTLVSGKEKAPRPRPSFLKPIVVEKNVRFAVEEEEDDGGIGSIESESEIDDEADSEDAIFEVENEDEEEVEAEDGDLSSVSSVEAEEDEEDDVIGAMSSSDEEEDLDDEIESIGEEEEEEDCEDLDELAL